MKILTLAGAVACLATGALAQDLVRLATEGAYPPYTNEAIFLFHATTLVFFTGFPAIQQKGDALYYAQYFADKTFNPFVPYPILAGYFILLTLAIIGLFQLGSRRLNRHMPGQGGRWRAKLQVIR